MTSAPLNDGRISDPQLLATALQNVSASLDVVAPDAFVGVENAIQMYVKDKAIAHSLGIPAEQKLLIKRTISTLEKAAKLTVRIAPEYGVQIERLLEAQLPPGSDGHSCCPLTLICRVLDAAEAFVVGFNPQIGPGTDIALETAIRKLIPLMEALTSGQVTVSMNKNKDGGATLRSSEAKAIGELLQSVDPELSIRTIATMIRKVQAAPVRSKPYISTICEVDPSNGLLGYLDPPQPTASR